MPFWHGCRHTSKSTSSPPPSMWEALNTGGVGDAGNGSGRHPAGTAASLDTGAAQMKAVRAKAAAVLMEFLPRRAIVNRAVVLAPAALEHLQRHAARHGLRQ